MCDHMRIMALNLGLMKMETTLGVVIMFAPDGSSSVSDAWILELNSQLGTEL